MRRYMFMKNAVCLVCVLALQAFGCGEKLDPRPAKGGESTGGDGGIDTVVEVVYSSNVATIKPILDTYCIECHSSELSGADRDGAPQGIDFDTYEGAVANAQAGNNEIQSGGMPPSGDGLTAEEKRLFQLWLDTGLNR
jgi:uncharacterized membrane protein